MLATLLTLTLTLTLANDDPCARTEVGTKLSAPLPANGEVAFDTDNWWPEPVPTLLDADGVELPATVVEAGSYDVLVPDLLLPAGSYTVWFGEGFERSFQVEGDADHEPPPPPVFQSVLRETSKDGDTMKVAFEPLGGDQHLLEVEISPTGNFAADGYRTHLFGRATLMGSRSCSGTFPPGYDHRQSYVLRARSVDMAGNTSDWTRLAVGEGGLGCSSTGASMSGLLGLVGLLGMRRRAG
jgi:hypothetical protein